MYTNPSMADLLRAAMISVNRDIGPEVVSNRGKQCLLMTQVLLQWCIQRVENEAPILAAEHNEMTALYREVAACFADGTGEVIERIRQRGTNLGGHADVPAPFPAAQLAKQHQELSAGLIDLLTDLDKLIQEAEPKAPTALTLVRQHLAMRSGRDFQTLLVNPGSMAGRE